MGWAASGAVILAEITSEQRPSVPGLTSDWPFIYLHGTGLNSGRNLLHRCPCAGTDTAALLSQIEGRMKAFSDQTFFMSSRNFVYGLGYFLRFVTFAFISPSLFETKLQVTLCIFSSCELKLRDIFSEIVPDNSSNNLLLHQDAQICEH